MHMPNNNPQQPLRGERCTWPGRDTPNAADFRTLSFGRRPLLGVEVGGIWRWAGPVEFLGMLPGVRLLAPFLHWPWVAAVLGFDR